MPGSFIEKIIEPFIAGYSPDQLKYMKCKGMINLGFDLLNECSDTRLHKRIMNLVDKIDLRDLIQALNKYEVQYILVVG